MFDSNKLAVFKVDRCVLYLGFYLNPAKSKLAGKFQRIPKDSCTKPLVLKPRTKCFKDVFPLKHRGFMHPLRGLSKRKRLSVVSFGIASPNNQPNNLPNKKRIIFPIYGYYYKKGGCILQKNTKSKIKRE